jgi:hypothetical protein
MQSFRVSSLSTAAAVKARRLSAVDINHVLEAVTGGRPLAINKA